MRLRNPIGYSLGSTSFLDYLHGQFPRTSGPRELTVVLHLVCVRTHFEYHVQTSLENTRALYRNVKLRK